MIKKIVWSKDERYSCSILIEKDSKDSNAFHLAFFYLSPNHRRLVNQLYLYHQQSEEQALETAKDWINDNLFKMDNIQPVTSN